MWDINKYYNDDDAQQKQIIDASLSRTSLFICQFNQLILNVFNTGQVLE